MSSIVLAEELAAQTQNRVLRVDATALQNLQMVDPSQVSTHCEETEIDNLLTLSSRKRQRPASWRSAGFATGERLGVGSGVSRRCLKALRWNFDYVLIDCPSPAVSSEATTLAPLVDGVCVVVKAGQTRRGQIQRCQQMIETAGGNFLGFILNQRQYPVQTGFTADCKRGRIV